MKVGELVAELTLDTSKFNTGIKKAEADTAALKSGAIIAAGALTSLGVAAMESANRAAEFAAEIKDVATVTGLSTDQVQRWKYAAEQSGVSFNSLTVAMRMLTQNIGDVDNQNSALKASLDSIGVSAKTVNGDFKDTNTLMLETLTALQKIDDPIKRNTAAMQLYGRSWSELAGFLEKDVDLAKKMAAADPITKYKLDQADAYKKKMEGLTASMDGVVVKIGTSLIPAFDKITDWFVNATPYVSGFFDFLNGLIDNAAVNMAWLADVVNGTFNRMYGTNYTTNNEQRVKTEIAASKVQQNAESASYTSASYQESESGTTVGSTESAASSSSASTTKVWSAQELYNKYEAGVINKTQLNSMLAKEDLLGQVVQTSSGKFYNTATGMFSNTYSSSSAGNPYAGNEGYYGSTQLSDTGVDISGSATQNVSTLPTATLTTYNPMTGWGITQEQATAFQSAFNKQSAALFSRYNGQGWGTTNTMETWRAAATEVYNAAIAAGIPPETALQMVSIYGGDRGVSEWSKFSSAMSSAPVVEAPTVSDYSTTSVSYTSSGAIKSNYSAGFSTNASGQLTISLILDGKVVAQSVVENLASLGVRI